MAETNQTTMQAAAFNADGSARDQRADLPAGYFDGTVNVPVMHQAVKAFLANQRQGTASTKNRKFVTGGNQKPWRQKGTGRARQGSTRAPHWPGGGTVFGPTPRGYEQKVQRKVKALARKSAFNARPARATCWSSRRWRSARRRRASCWRSSAGWAWPTIRCSCSRTGRTPSSTAPGGTCPRCT